MSKDVRALLGLSLLAAVLGALPAAASFISINTTVSTTVSRDTLRVTVKVENSGDEAACNGQAQISVLGQQIVTEKVKELPVGKPVIFTKDVPLDAKTPGVYPLIVTVFYTDANQYPFSALASHVFACGAQGGPVNIMGNIDTMTLSGKGKLSLSLKNLGDAAIAATVRLVAPRELTVNGDQIDVVVPPRGEQHARFTLNNFSARAGSTYPIVAVAEYDQDGTHQTALVRGTVNIVEKKQALGLNYSVLAGILVVLVAAFIVFEKFRK